MCVLSQKVTGFESQQVVMVLKAIKITIFTFLTNKSFASSQDEAMFTVEMNNTKPMHLIITSPDKAYGLSNHNYDVHFYVSNVSLF